MGKKRRKSIFVAKPIEKQTDEETDGEEEPKLSSPKPKKRKQSSSSAVESSSDEIKTKQIQLQPKSPLKSPLKSPSKSNPVPTIVNHTPSKDVNTAKKKLKLNSFSESSDTNERQESDAASSSTSVSSKKKSKKEKKEKKDKVVEPPGDKPPSTIEQYFAKYVHTGKPRKAQKAFNKLPKKELKELKSEYNEKVESYVNKLKIYLASLSQADAIAYVSIKEIIPICSN